MNIMIVLGAIGGALPDLLRIIASKNSSKIPEFLTWPMFWAGLALQVALGGFLGYLLHPADKLSAVAYGFSGPELITRLVAGINRPEPAPKTAPESTAPAAPPRVVQFSPPANSASALDQLFGFWRS